MYNDSILFLGTKDLEKSTKLCIDILGLTLYKDQTKCKIFRINEGSAIGFCEHIDVVHGNKSPIITLVVDDVDFVYNRLTAFDVEASKPSLNEYFKIYHFFFKDDNGYTFEIQKFID